MLLIKSSTRIYLKFRKWCFSYKKLAFNNVNNFYKTNFWVSFLTVTCHSACLSRKQAFFLTVSLLFFSGHGLSLQSLHSSWGRRASAECWQLVLINSNKSDDRAI